MMTVKLILSVFTVLMVCVACGGAPSEESALRALEASPEYREAVSTFGDPPTDETTAYNEAIKHDTHSDYIALLVHYPETAHRAEIEGLLTRFRLFETAEEKIVDYETIEAMCWPQQGRMGYWRSGALGGMMMGGPTFGPVMFYSPQGSIQLISGGYSREQGGYKFSAGSSFIYSTKCHEGSD